MRKEKWLLWEEEEYRFPIEGKFRPNLVAYLHDRDGADRPGVVVCPGGAYCLCSWTEGEIAAMPFYRMGYNAFVLTYTTDLLMRTPLKLQPLRDLSRAVALLRSKAEETHTRRLFLCGFSAGAHLCGTLAVHWDDTALAERGAFSGFSNRPEGVILSYPVISAGSSGHRGSFRALLGRDARPEELSYMSLEKQVRADMPPVFLWHFLNDRSVPAENSFLFTESCHSSGVPCESHIFTSGVHGMSVANEDWASGPVTGLYAMEAYLEMLQLAIDSRRELLGFFGLSEDVSPGTEAEKVFREMAAKRQKDNKPDPAIALWPTLADAWMRNILDSRG